MTQEEHDKNLFALLNLYFTPYVYSKKELDEAAKCLAKEMDKEITNTIIDKANKHERI